MNVVYVAFDGPTHWDWIQKRHPFLRVTDTCGFMAVDGETAEPIAAAIFDTFMHNTAQVSMIIDNMAAVKHGFIEEMAQFLFDGYGKDYAYCKVSANNTKSLRITKRAGFKEVGRLSGAGLNGCDHILFEMHKDDCIFYTPVQKIEVA